jgi:SAM-dependent methyltransferase
MLARNGVTPRSICEVGCGAGEILRELRAATGESVRLVGYDVSPQALELARPKADTRLTFRLGSVPERAEHPFDLVLLIDLIEHLEDYFGFLRGIRSRGRHVVLHVPLELSAQGAARGGFFTTVRASAGHLHYFSQSTLLAVLAETGYEVLDHEYTAGAVDFPPTSLGMWAARLPRRVLARVAPDLAARLLGGFSLLVLARPDHEPGP